MGLAGNVDVYFDTIQYSIVHFNPDPEDEHAFNVSIPPDNGDYTAEDFVAQADIFALTVFEGISAEWSGGHAEISRSLGVTNTSAVVERTDITPS